jgi:hypothetical protein
LAIFFNLSIKLSLVLLIIAKSKSEVALEKLPFAREPKRMIFSGL